MTPSVSDIPLTDKVKFQEETYRKDSEERYEKG